MLLLVETRSPDVLLSQIVFVLVIYDSFAPALSLRAFFTLSEIFWINAFGVPVRVSLPSLMLPEIPSPARVVRVSSMVSEVLTVIV